MIECETFTLLHKEGPTVEVHKPLKKCAHSRRSEILMTCHGDKLEIIVKQVANILLYTVEPV